MMHILLSYIYPDMMVTLIEIAVKNRLKWIVILLLYHEIIFMFPHFVWLNSKCSPFLLSQCSWCMPPPTPFNALDTCLPLNPSILLRMPASPLLPFNAIEDALPPPPCLLPSNLLLHTTSCLPSTLILKLIWLLAANPISFWFRFCFIHFDFLIIKTMRRNFLLISHVFLYLNTAVPFA